jgi:hypothetical protein
MQDPLNTSWAGFGSSTIHMMPGRLRAGEIPVPSIEYFAKANWKIFLILDQIDQWLSEGRNIYVHCRDGVGRTGGYRHFITHNFSYPRQVYDLMGF